MKYKDIQKNYRSHYHVNMHWLDIRTWLERKADILDPDPDFQRAHVWEEERQIKYLEHILRDGEGGRAIFFNCPGWMNSFKGPLQIVDGKQRLQAVLLFLDDKIPAFGTLCSEFEGRMPAHAEFNLHVHDLPTRAEVLEWYLQLNEGLVAHTSEELNKVRELLKKEK